MFEEMKRYVRFEAGDEAALTALAPHAEPHFAHIAEEFYARLGEHPEATRVFSGPEQVKRLQSTLCEWMMMLLRGPWDRDYYERRARIGRVHVRIALPQRYMFGAMDLIRLSLTRIAQDAFEAQAELRTTSVRALQKILDLELAVMLETYREAFVDQVQELERLEKALLEQRLAISEARYVEVVEKAEVLITTFAPAGEILLFNRSCEDVLGVPRAEALGKDWFQLFFTGKEREAVRRCCDVALAGGRAEPFEAAVPQAGRSARRVRWHFTTLPSAGGVTLCAIGLDVTEAHEMAVRTRRAERLASLGTMAAGLAHEIRNPLNAAHLQLTVLQRRLGRAQLTDADGVKAAADLVSSEMKRLASLVEEFLQFARPQPVRLADYDLRSTIEEVVSLLAPEAHAAGIEVALEPGPGVPAGYDAERVKQVILNLVRNAVEATGRGGRVGITVRGPQGADDLPCVEIADDGPGIAADAPIFEPFFTTKSAGTGLGLAIVHRIVSDHGGKVSVRSRPGQTVFTVALPRSATS